MTSSRDRTSQPQPLASKLAAQIDVCKRSLCIESESDASTDFTSALGLSEHILSRRAHFEPDARWNTNEDSLMPMAIQGYCLQATQHLRLRQATEPGAEAPGLQPLRREMIIYGNLLSRLAQLHAQEQRYRPDARCASTIGFLLVPTWIKDFEVHQVDLMQAMVTTKGLHTFMSHALGRVSRMRASYSGPADPFVDTAAAVHLAFVLPHHNAQGLPNTVVCSLNEDGLSTCTINSQPLGTLEASQIALKLAWMLRTNVHMPCDPARLESYFAAARQNIESLGNDSREGLQVVRTLTFADIRLMASDPLLEMALQILDVLEREVITRLVERAKSTSTPLFRQKGLRAWSLAYFRRHGVDLTRLARAACNQLAELSASATR